MRNSEDNLRLFLVPIDLTDAFNGARAKAVPVYFDSPRNEELVDAQRVLAGLATTSAAGEINRSAIYLTELDNFLHDDMKKLFPTFVRDLVEGKSGTGFGIACLRVANAKGQPVHLLAFEDKFRKKTLVVGDEPVADDFRKALADTGVTYMTRGDAKLAETLESFFSNGVICREYGGKEGKKMVPLSYYNFKQDVVRSLASLSVIPFDSRLERGKTIGGLIQAAREYLPTIYTSIAKSI